MPPPFHHGGAEVCVDDVGASSVPKCQLDNNHLYAPDNVRKAPCEMQATLEISPAQDVLGIESSHHGKDLRICDHNTPGNTTSSGYLDKFGVRWENDCSMLRRPHAQSSRQKHSKNLSSRSFVPESDLQFCTKANSFDNHALHQEGITGVVDAVRSMDGDTSLSPAESEEQQEHMQASYARKSETLSRNGYHQLRSSSKLSVERQDCLGSPQSILYHGIFSNSARMLTTCGRSFSALNFDRSACPSVGDTEESVDFEVACSEEGDRVVTLDSLSFPTVNEEIGGLTISPNEDGTGRNSVPPVYVESMDATLGHIGAFSSPRHYWSEEPINFESREANNFVDKGCQQGKLDSTLHKTKGIVDRHGVRWTGDCEYLPMLLDSSASCNEVQFRHEKAPRTCPQSLVDEDFSSRQTSQTGILPRDTSPAYADVKSDIDSMRGCQSQLQLFNGCSNKTQLIHVPAQTTVNPMDSATDLRVDDVVSKKVTVPCSTPGEFPVLKLAHIKFQYCGWAELRASWNFLWKNWRGTRPSLLAARAICRQAVAVLKVAGGCVGGMFWNVDTGHGS